MALGVEGDVVGVLVLELFEFLAVLAAYPARGGVVDVDRLLARLSEQGDAQLQQWQSALAGQQDQSRGVDEIAERVEHLRQVLIEGFRLK